MPSFKCHVTKKRCQQWKQSTKNFALIINTKESQLCRKMKLCRQKESQTLGFNLMKTKMDHKLLMEWYKIVETELHMHSTGVQRTNRNTVYMNEADLHATYTQDNCNEGLKKKNFERPKTNYNKCVLLIILVWNFEILTISRFFYSNGI